MKKQAKSGSKLTLSIMMFMGTIVMMLVAVAALIDLLLVEVPHIRTITQVSLILISILGIICGKKFSEIGLEKITLTTRRGAIISLVVVIIGAISMATSIFILMLR